MSTINLFRGCLTQILGLDLYFLTIFPTLAAKAGSGDGGLGLRKVKDTYKDQCHSDLVMSGTLAGLWLLVIHMLNTDNSSWKAYTSQR